MKRTLRTRTVLLAAVAGLTLSVAACGSDTPADTSSDTTTPAEDTTAEDTTAEETTDAEQTTEAETAGENFGAGCADVPADGDGSFAGMADDPVATAASSNPLLSTLVDAVTAAGLVDTLNDPNAEFTVFAPANTAFDAIPEADLTALLADVPALSNVLTYHVLPMRVAPEDLAGTFTTVQGGELTVSGEGEAFTVGDANANVVCGNVQTANATVYIIDSVLMPPA